MNDIFKILGLWDFSTVVNFVFYWQCIEEKFDVVLTVTVHRISFCYPGSDQMSLLTNLPKPEEKCPSEPTLAPTALPHPHSLPYTCTLSFHSWNPSHTQVSSGFHTFGTCYSLWVKCPFYPLPSNSSFNCPYQTWHSYSGTEILEITK